MVNQFTKLVSLVILASIAFINAEDSFLYHNTRICARHKSYLCLSYDKKSSQLVLSGRQRLRFEIETVERVNLQLNRVYTYATDKATRKKVKSCLVRKFLDDGNFAVDLSPCDTDDNELVLAVAIPAVGFNALTADEFVLKEISYIEDGNTISSPYCLSQAYNQNGALEIVSEKTQLKNKAPLFLTDCGENENAYGQEFKARDYSKRSSSRLVATQAPQVKAEIGMFCLSGQQDLCLGLSLTNGTTLEKDKLVQVKNYTKNEAKGKHDLKLRWYHDLKNNRIATASNLDFCLEAIYGKSIGRNRAGSEQFDDVVHLGSCDISLVTKDSEATQTLPKSEIFYTYPVKTTASSYLELRTEVPSGVDGESTVKCVSVVKCIKHDNDHCTPYNSVPVYTSELLAQGAHARLKDCNSEELVSQRFFYRADTEVTFPPTKTPTNPPTPPPTTSNPTKRETSHPTKHPTQIVNVEPIVPTTPPPKDETDQQTTEDNQTSPKKQSTGLLLALALVGLFCLLIILVALAYYYKNRGEFTGLPEEDENFIARV